MNKTKTKKKENLYFKNYDLYSDANPKDTIPIKYKSINAKCRKTCQIIYIILY